MTVRMMAYVRDPDDGIILQCCDRCSTALFFLGYLERESELPIRGTEFTIVLYRLAPGRTLEECREMCQ